MQINKYLVTELKALGLLVANPCAPASSMGRKATSEEVDYEIPGELKQIYRTVWEIPMRSLIDMAADRGAFIDQSQSLNLFAESPNIGRLSSMYMYAWKRGIKTTYYLRSRPATKIAKTTVAVANRVSTEAPPEQPATVRLLQSHRLLPGQPRVLRSLPIANLFPKDDSSFEGSSCAKPEGQRSRRTCFCRCFCLCFSLASSFPKGICCCSPRLSSFREAEDLLFSFVVLSKSEGSVSRI